MFDRASIGAIESRQTVHRRKPRGRWRQYWHGARGDASDIATLLHCEIVKTLNTSELKARFDELGFEITADTPAEFATEIKTELESGDQSGEYQARIARGIFPISESAC